MEFQGILFAFVLINILNMNNSNNNQIIRFDWAMKRLLRNKANFSVLEGLLTTLPGEKDNNEYAYFQRMLFGTSKSI